MNEKEIQGKLDDLVGVMLSKGLREPTATVLIASQRDPAVLLQWKDESADFGTAREHLSSDNLSGSMSLAVERVRSLPSAQDRKLTEFMKVVAKAIDLGRENGIDAEFINPLTVTMKKLSENALTYRGEA